jgi:hypothetical protein
MPKAPFPASWRRSPAGQPAFGGVVQPLPLETFAYAQADLMEGGDKSRLDSPRVTTRTFFSETLPQFVTNTGDYSKEPNEHTQHTPACDGNKCRPPDTYWSTFIGRMSPRILPLFLISTGDSVEGARERPKIVLRNSLVALLLSGQAIQRLGHN